MPFSPALRNHFLSICARERDVIRAFHTMDMADLIPVLSRNQRRLEVLRELYGYVMWLESGFAYNDEVLVA
jgi:hypothetical protein